MADPQNPSAEPIPPTPTGPVALCAGQPSGETPDAVVEPSAPTVRRIREWEQVLAKEQEAIAVRRDRQGFAATTTAAPVGLAFSGGGIRSASFNLGLLQAFYKNGLLRFVDYLSTISGGSYIGAWFSQQVCRLPRGTVIGPDNLPLADGEVSQALGDEGTRRQEYPRTRGMVWQANPAIAKLLRAGHYLSHPLLFANRYLIGLVKTNLIFGSFVLLVCAVLALAWRMLDMPTICEAILVLSGGVLIEAVRPFMIPLIFLLAWALGWFLFTLKPVGSPKGLGTGVFLGLATLTTSLAVLEQFGFYRDNPVGILWLPDSTLWKILRPLPLLLTIAWPMACVMRTPPSPVRRPWIVAKLFAGLAALTLAVFIWPWLDERYPILDFGQVVARVTLVLLGGTLVFREGLALVLTFISADTARMAHRNLRWFLLLAGASALVAAAVWLANPSINFATTTTLTARSSFTEGRAEKHDSWITPILGVLVTFLLPFLRPRRLLESGLRPKNFWEPWVFRLACTAAVIGIPLVGVYFFARHNLSGRNSGRLPLLHHAEFDWGLFWQRIRHEHLNRPQSPGDQIWRHLCAQVCAAEDDLRIFADVPANERSSRFENVLEYVAQMVREQPDPLSERVAQKKKWIVGQLNRLIFLQRDEQGEIKDIELDDFKRNTEKLFGPLIEKQKDAQRQLLSEEHPELDRRPWPNWQEIKPLLRQVEKREPGTGLELAAQKRAYQQLNRLVLEAYLRDELSNQARVLRPVVVARDQGLRVGLVLALAALFSLTAWLVRVNSTSLHRYYRAQLSRVYLDYDRDRAEEDEGSRQLSHLDTVARGGPYHLIGAALNVWTIKEVLMHVFGGSKDQGGDELRRPRTDSTTLEHGVKKECLPAPAIRTAPDLPPSGCTDAFLFSNQFCGSEYTGFEPTRSFEFRAGVRLGDGVALSGAAVSLTQIDNPLILLLMTVLNLRLGQWLPRPNPAVMTGRTRPPNLWELLAERAKRDSRRYFFVTDGGHHDNLGLEILLRRRCRLIIVSDATCDPEYGFLDFLRVWQRIEQEHGIRLLLLSGSGEDQPSGLNRVRPLCLRDDRVKSEPTVKEDKDKSPERKTSEKWSSSHYFLAQIQYPDDAPDAEKAYLIYLKPSITGDEAEDLKGHWASHPAFPHDPTSNQFYDENMVNAYRQLGEHIGQKLSEELSRSAGINWWQEKDFSIRHWVEFWVQSMQSEGLAQAEKGKPLMNAVRGTRGDRPAAPAGPKRAAGKQRAPRG
jgi:hypothetical protein